MLIPGPAQEQRCVHTISEGMFTRSEASDLAKKLVTRDKTKPLGSQRVGLESEQPRVTWFKHLVVLLGMRKC